jgi:oligopeptidase B
MISYAEDTKGDKIYTVYVIDAQNGELISSLLMGIGDSLEWDDSETLVYITMDDIHRPFKVWRHHMGSD